jgi:DsbC/DsbD-like thiol-disulfide interchange protein
MGAEKHHAPLEARVGHAWHRDQDLSGKLHSPNMDPDPPRLKPPHQSVTVTTCRCNAVSFRRPFFYLPPMIRSAALLALLASPALATTQDDVLSATLRPGWQMENGSHMAALDLTLAQGWKTYWRSPGDSGIPPSFDWSASENVKSVRIHWPAPEVFHTNGMQTIGYHDRLVLPVEITPSDPARPVRLKVRMELGVCDEICLPAALDLVSDLAVPGAPDASINAALSERAATAQEAGVTGISCSIDPITDGLRLTARIGLPDPGQPEVVAFETADRTVWVAEAITERQGSELIATTELVPPNGAPFALDRSKVTVTILAGSGAVEVKGCPAP